MFFIGGINSVLPYIIYLSLIWVFLIFGFGGKVLQAGQLLSPWVYRAEKLNLQRYDQRIIHYYEHGSINQKQHVQKKQAFPAWNCFFPPSARVEIPEPKSFVAVNQHQHSTFSLRGPPASAFIS